ncbi:hypothetical protein [Streptomyces sp. NPDC058045]|uniref:hypothetical protein n=1 Tax=Streptomyces sp. NPDC058045 TaxID=3346311 RepID=UPI0036E5689C
MGEKPDSGVRPAPRTDSREDGRPRADEAAPAEEPRRRKRIDLNVPQVAGSAVAAVVAAKLAANLGVYGTILGAGVVSIVATCGGSLFQHFFRRTGEQIRDAAVSAKPRSRQVPVTRNGRPVPATFRPETGPPPARHTITWGTGPSTTAGPGAPEDRPTEALHPVDHQTHLLPRPTTGADPNRTQLLPEATEAERTRLLAPVDGDRTQRLARVPEEAATRVLRVDAVAGAAGGPVDAAGDDGATRILRTLDGGPPGQPPYGEGPLPGDVADESAGAGPHRSRARGWKRPLIAAGVVFVVTMGGITTYELASGESFAGEGRTTIGDAFTGHRSGHRSDPSTTEPTATPSDGATPEQSGTFGGGPSRTPGADRPGGGAADPRPTGSTGTGNKGDQSTGSGATAGQDTGATADPTPTESATDPGPAAPQQGTPTG